MGLISGNVTDPAGVLPPAGTLVYLLSPGLANLGLSAGLWHLTYGLDPQSGYVVLDHHKVVPIESGKSLNVPLSVAQRDSLLQGAVLDPAGNPLPEAMVSVNSFGGLVGQVALRTISQEDGSFSLLVCTSLPLLKMGQLSPPTLTKM